MRSDAMAAPAGTERPSSKAINPDYRSSTDIMTRSGGLVWGLILLVVGALWFASAAGWIALGSVANLILPFLIIVAGLYMLVTKMMR